jgi:hypothetical protein
MLIYCRINLDLRLDEINLCGSYVQSVTHEEDKTVLSLETDGYLLYNRACIPLPIPIVDVKPKVCKEGLGLLVIIIIIILLKY